MARARTPFYFPQRLFDYDDAYLDCRKRHAWRSLGYYRFKHMRQTFLAEVHVCTHCSSEKEDYFDLDFNYIDSSRTYPSGYLVKLTEAEREQGWRFTSRTAARVQLQRAVQSKDIAASKEELVKRASGNGR